MTQENNTLEKINSWIKNSITLKLITITILMLLLLIPASMIESIIEERELLNNQTISEVSSKWAEKQQINGPILTIPLIYEHVKNDELILTTKYYHVLPEDLNIKGNIEPERLKRGIYEVVIYKSNLVVSGNFLLKELPDDINLKAIRYDQSFLTVGISDLRGIKDQIVFKWDNHDLIVKPGTQASASVYSGVNVKLPNIENNLNKSIAFEFALNLQGSQNMSFVPLGNVTEVNLSSSWDAPSFNGNFLPDHREVTKEGFKAKWKILQLNRNLPQSWIGVNQIEKMNAASFGVDLIVPLDDYQKSMRSAKYGAMTIALTFLMFFLVEIMNRKKIHPFQYALVGLSLCLFYVLLVSISEHTNFNFAYGISTLAIVTMISLYSISVFKMKKITILLILILSGIYGFLFVTLQLADFALLMGSIGLSFILGATMYFTRNINWYKPNIDAT